VLAVRLEVASFMQWPIGYDAEMDPKYSDLVPFPLHF